MVARAVREKPRNQCCWLHRRLVALACAGVFRRRALPLGSAGGAGDGRDAILCRLPIADRFARVKSARTSVFVTRFRVCVCKFRGSSVCFIPVRQDRRRRRFRSSDSSARSTRSPPAMSRC